MTGACAWTVVNCHAAVLNGRITGLVRPSARPSNHATVCPVLAAANNEIAFNAFQDRSRWRANFQLITVKKSRIWTGYAVELARRMFYSTFTNVS